jgi:hypothetical protein
MRRNEQGTAYIFAVLVIALLGIITESLFFRTRSSTEITGHLLHKQKLAYIAEGISQIASQLAQEYFSVTPTPTSAGLNAYVAAKVATISVAPYAIDTLNLAMSGAAALGQIPSGPFVGMDSYQIPISIDVKMMDPNGGVYSAVSKTSVLAKVSLFQFSLFSDLPGATSYLAPGMAMDVRGRIHVNGDFCMGNFGSMVTPLRVEKVTASGAIRNLREPACWAAGVAVANSTSIATDQVFAAFASLDPGAGNGCVNCNASGMDWKAYAIATWQGNLLDSAHLVQKFRLPLNGTETVQDGVRADLSGIPNTNSMRVLVDPVLPAEPLSVSQQKFAYKADIRIINGVWFLKDPANPNAWPGLPIWSDHPGRFTTANEEGIEGALAVGQEDIRIRWNGTPTAWAPGLTPTRFSFYEYDPAAQRLFDNPVGIVSYGSLFRDAAAGPAWRPGHWARAASTELCSAGNTCTNCNDATPLDALTAGSLTCDGGVQPNRADFLLNGVRSGYNDGHVASSSAGIVAIRRERAKIFPMNVDVAALRDALADVTPGELGSYFGAGRLMNRPFNGVLYVTNTWPGSMQGLGGGFANDYPFQSAQLDASEPPATHTAQQQALPYALCSPLNAVQPGGAGGSPFDGVAETHFVVPDCAKYAPGYVAADRIDARPNAVRIVNGRTIDPVVFATGLTIATNLPAYVLGDYNINSDTSSAVAAPWVPALIAADQVVLLSTAWTDANSRWDTNISAIPRLAENTTYNLSILSGGAVTTAATWSGGLENLPRYIEKWNWGGVVKTARIRGSLVQGFNSVYHRHPVGPSNPPAAWGDITYLPPARDFAFDPHLDRWANQPPGSPSFDIYAVNRWVLQ